MIVLEHPLEKIHEDLPERTKKLLAEAEKELRVEMIEAAGEVNNDTFVLFYAFYKEIGSYHRFSIPTYREMYQSYEKMKQQSFFFFAHENKTPIAALWVTIWGDEASCSAFGSIRKGYELNADYYLVWQAIKEMKKRGTTIFLVDPTGPLFPRDSKRFEELSRAMITS